MSFISTLIHKRETLGAKVHSSFVKSMGTGSAGALISALWVYVLLQGRLFCAALSPLALLLVTGKSSQADNN